MTVSTIAYCRGCKWRSSVQPFVDGYAAGAPCPTCGRGVSTLHCDPTYTATDTFGRHYVEAAEIAAQLTEAGVSTVNPVGVTLPAHPTPHPAPNPASHIP